MGDTAAIQCLTFAPDGTLYGAGDSLFTFDVETAQRTLVGSGGYADLRGIHFIAAACLTVVDETVTCSPDGATFTWDVTAANGCTGELQDFSFSGSTGATGQDACFTVLVTGDQGGFCCATTLCVPVPDCEPEPALDIDGDGRITVEDFLILLAR